MKIVLIGGGSYVFAPTVIDDLILKARLSDFEFVFVDINQEAAQLMANLAKRIADDTGIRVKTFGTSDRTEALKNADYIITSIAYEGSKRWLTDYEICKREGIPDELRENGALSGIMYGFRNITLIMGICRDIEKLCPKAVLLNVSNPLTRVLTAVNRYTSVKSYGFCNVAQFGSSGYQRVAALLGCHYSDIDVTSAGINHFAWITAVHDRQTGADLLPRLIDALFKDNYGEGKIQQRWYDMYGAISAPPSGHVCEFLPIQADVSYLDGPPYHGSAEDRIKRLDDIKKMIAGELDYKTVPHFLGTSWEHPGLFAAVMHNKESLHLNAINVPNNGYLPQLPAKAVVEVPANIKNGTVMPYTDIQLPKQIVDICCNQLEVIEMTAQAAMEGNKKLAMEIIDIDTSIIHKAEATRALSEMLSAHADILPQFTKQR